MGRLALFLISVLALVFSASAMVIDSEKATQDQKALATLLQLFAKGNFAKQADGSSDGTDKPLADDTTLELTVVADDSDETAADDNSVTLADDNVNGEIIGVLLEALSESGQLDFDDIVKSCTKGKCTFCAKNEFLHVCVEAGIIHLGIDMTVTVNNYIIYHKEISAYNPPPFCVDKIPGLDHVANVCLQFYNIDINHASGCVKITFKVKIGKIGKKISMKIGCFKIPQAEVTEVEEVKEANESLKFQPFA